MIVDKLDQLNIKANDKIGYHIKQFYQHVISKYQIYSTFYDYLDDSNIGSEQVKSDLDEYFSLL